MKQSRSTSLIKSIVSTAVGFAVAMIVNALVLPLFFRAPTLSENVAITVIYTVVSIGRGYVMERVFEAMGWRTRMSAFAMAALAERQRQIHGEGWSSYHDDDHDPGDLARAGAAYAAGAGQSWGEPPQFWPWDGPWWKPTDTRRDLVKAAALIIAEGERHDRNRKREPRDWDRPRPPGSPGYQPAPGPRPKSPTTGSGVIQPAAGDA